LATKVSLVKAIVFQWSDMDWKLDYKKAECQRTDAFEQWCWRRLLRVPWTARRSNQSISDHWKTIALTRETFVAKVMSLLFIFYINLFILMGGYLLLIWYWFCHNLPQVYMCSPSCPHSHLPPFIIPLGHPSAPAPSILYHASNMDWRFLSYMILYMFQCRSTKSPHPLLQTLCFLICCLG